MKKKNTKDLDYTVPIIVVVGLFVLMLLLNAVVLSKRSERNMRYKKESPVAYQGREHIFILDQKISNRVAILSVGLTQNGFIVIYNNKNEIVGKSPLLIPGLYSNKALILSQTIAPGDEIFATLYTDDGDGNFNQNKDSMEAVTTWFTNLR